MIDIITLLFFVWFEINLLATCFSFSTLLSFPCEDADVHAEGKSISNVLQLSWRQRWPYGNSDGKEKVVSDTWCSWSWSCSASASCSWWCSCTWRCWSSSHHVGQVIKSSGHQVIMLIKSLCHHAGHQVIRLIKLVLLIRSVIIDQFDHIGQINCFDQVLNNICTYHHSPGNYACAGRVKKKHCQRHNEPEGWVLLRSHTNLNQISSSESQPSTNF